MRVYAKLFKYNDIQFTGSFNVLGITRGGEHNSLLRAIHPGPTWKDGPTEIDLSEDVLVIAGGRKSIARFLLVDKGNLPKIRGFSPQVGIYHQKSGMFEKAKTGVLLTGRGLAPPPLKHVDYEPLTPHLRGGDWPWNGNDVYCSFNPRELASALCHLWGLDMNKQVLNDKYMLD